MEIYWDVALVVLASLIAAAGVAAITRDWVLPWKRRQVSRPRLHGWGQLVLAFAVYWQALFSAVLSGPDARATGTLIGGVMAVAGVVVMYRGQSDKRQGSGAS